MDARRADATPRVWRAIGDGAGMRPELQALRALAVAAVVAYHLWPNTIRGGYVGVDVFFVISGFLIIGHLVREVSDGRLSVVRFWARRARRLLPAAFLVLIVCAALTVAVVPDTRWGSTFTQIGASAVYVQNWALSLQAVDYMAAGSAPSIVQHFWSLSVEEQFYIVLPLIVALVWSVRRSNRTLLVVLATLTVASLGYSVWLTVTNPSLAYLSTFTRAWEFLAGGLLVFAPAPRGALRVVMVWGGAVFIFGSVMLFDDASPFPGVIAAIPVLGAGAMIAAGDVVSTRWLVHRRPVQYLGDISYSVYLWHWPVIVAFPLILHREMDAVGSAGVIVLTVLLAAVTKRFVEDRFRFPRARRVWPTFAATGGAAVVVMVLAGCGVYVDAERNRAAAADVEVLAGPCWGAGAMVEDCVSRPLAMTPAFASTDMFGVGDDICTGAQVPVGDNVECNYGDIDSDYTIALVGDSHARNLVPAFEAIAIQRGWHLVTLIRSSCPFNATPLSQHGAVVEGCSVWKVAVMDRLLETRPDLVITTSLRAYGYEIGGAFNVGTADEQVAGYVTQLNVLKAAGIPAMVVSDIPYLPEPAPDCVAAGGTCAYPRVDVDDNLPDAFTIAALQTGTPIIDLAPYLCDESCRDVIGGLIVYQDRHHLTVTFARTLAPYIGQQIDAAR